MRWNYSRNSLEMIPGATIDCDPGYSATFTLKTQRRVCGSSTWNDYGAITTLTRASGTYWGTGALITNSQGIACWRTKVLAFGKTDYSPINCWC
jgi:hypothetical protein